MKDSRRLVVVLAVFAYLLGGPAAATASVSTASPWSMFLGNAQHTGRSAFVASDTRVLRWSAQTGGSSSPAIGADGTIYVGTYWGVDALNPVNGAFRWRFFRESDVDGVTLSSPALGDDGLVYIGCGSLLCALDGADGTVRWTLKTDGWIDSSPVVSGDGIVYVGSEDGKLYAVDAATGQEKWEFAAESWAPGYRWEIHSSPALGLDGSVIFADSGGHVYAVDALTGIQRWKYATPLYTLNPNLGGGPAEILSSPSIGSDGTVYIGSQDGWLYAIDHQSGALMWVFDTGGEITERGVRSVPAVGSDGAIYVVNDTGVLFAVSPSGSKLWDVNLGTLYSESSPIIGADGTIYLGCNMNKVYAINADGSKKWQLSSGPYCTYKSAAALGADGTLYISGETYFGGVLRAIGKAPTSTVGTPVAPSQVRRSRTFTIYGYVAPKHTTGTYLVVLKFYKRNSSGAYVFDHSVSAKRYSYSSTKTKYKASVSLRSKGRWRVRAYHACNVHTGAYSGYDYITVK